MTRAISSGNFTTLLNYFAIGIGPIDYYAKTDSRGNPYLLFNEALMVVVYLYEQMAILGRARCKRLKDLVKVMPVHSGMEDGFINDVQKSAKERLEQAGQQPHSFFNFIFSTELKKEGLSLSDSNTKLIKKALERKLMLIKEADFMMQGIGAEGIGFGSCFPDLTKQMWENAYSSIDTKEWSKWRSLGVVSSERPPQFPSYKEHEQNVLKVVATYVSEHNPELLDTLALRSSEYWTPGKPLYE